MIPPGFPSDAPKNRWCLIGQWHDQPDPTKGETWDGFPSRSPTVLIGIGELDGKPASGSNTRRSLEEVRSRLSPTREMAFLSAVIRWSQQDDGQATIYFDEIAEPIAVLQGPNLHNGYQHFLKLASIAIPKSRPTTRSISIR